MRWLCLPLAACTSTSPTPETDADLAVVILNLAAFSVAPGEEAYVCQDFADPFDGSDAVSRWESHLSAGAHHLLVFYKPGASDGPLEDCSGSEFAAGPYGSQRRDDSLEYPEGVAASIPAGTGLRLQAHFLNSSDSPIEPTVQLSMTRSELERVQPAAVLFLSNLDIHVDPGAIGATVQKTCTLPWDVNLVQASGHMHRHGISFLAATSSSILFRSSEWADVTPAWFDPPLALPAGSDIQFTCTYDNPGATPLTYGESAATDEMCIFTAQFYPAPFGGWACF